ncbi:MAG TPA: hypothetical protein PLH27_03100, partial [bacterium]|nr:hypothetical protein [bacterium]
MISLTSTGRDTLLILSNSLIALNSVQTTPTLVSRGQDSILVRVSVTNLSSSVGRIDTIQLKFFDEAVSLLNTGFDVTPYSDLSDTVSGNTTKSFLFKVNIDAAADTGITTIDAVLKGRDEVSGTSVYDSLAVSADQWTIQIPAQLTVDSVWALPATVSQNQQNIPVNVVIRNTGVATARVDSVRLRYYYGSTLSTSDFVDSLTVPLGTITLVGGDSALYLFNTDALSSAASGTVRFYAVAFGQDNNSLQARVDTSRLRYDSVLVQTRPVLSYTANTLTPDTVTIGDAFNYRLDISNSGEANVILTPSTQLILRDVDSLKVNLQDTVFIASGYTRTLDFSTALIGLRIDSVYYPEVRFVGTENDNAFNAYLYITNDSVKILSPGLVSADSFGVYDKNGALSVNISAGDTFTVRLLVRNNGGARIENLAPQPGALSISGTTIPVLLSGPTPTTAILERQDSVRFQWTYRADSSGTVNLSVRAQGADAVTDSSVQSAQRNIFLTVQNAVADTLYALTLTTDTVQVYQFTDITVVARDTANRIAQADSVRFRVLTGTAGFRDTSRATIDTTIATDALGRATMRLFTGSIPSASLVRAYLRSTADDSVSFNIASVPRAVSSLQVAVNSSWTVGLNEAVTITALDQYGNVATNALSNVTLSGINTSSLQITPPGSLALTNGIASFVVRDTVTRGNLRLQATESVVGTQVLSGNIVVHHSAAARFTIDTVTINNFKIGNVRSLAVTLVDSFGNGVKDTSIAFRVINDGGGGSILSTNPTLTDSTGRAFVQYQSGLTVGSNIVTARANFGGITSTPDSVVFDITTTLLDANASYVDSSLAPREVSL